ncbi:MAG: hypothetical protein H6703_12775 [Myxococcales bacterium]|nr:hypothetical protein [Myxococcales bacterium]
MVASVEDGAALADDGGAAAVVVAGLAGVGEAAGEGVDDGDLDAVLELEERVVAGGVDLDVVGRRAGDGDAGGGVFDGDGDLEAFDLDRAVDDLVAVEAHVEVAGVALVDDADAHALAGLEVDGEEVGVVAADDAAERGADAGAGVAAGAQLDGGGGREVVVGLAADAFVVAAADHAAGGGAVAVAVGVAVVVLAAVFEAVEGDGVAVAAGGAAGGVADGGAGVAAGDALVVDALLAVGAVVGLFAAAALAGVGVGVAVVFGAGTRRR